MGQTQGGMSTRTVIDPSGPGLGQHDAKDPGSEPDLTHLYTFVFSKWYWRRYCDGTIRAGEGEFDPSLPVCSVCEGFARREGVPLP